MSTEYICACCIRVLILAQVTGSPALFIFLLVQRSLYAKLKDNDDRINQRLVEETHGRASGHPEATCQAATAGHFVAGDLDEASCPKDGGGMWLFLQEEKARKTMTFQQSGGEPS